MTHTTTVKLSDENMQKSDEIRERIHDLTGIYLNRSQTLKYALDCTLGLLREKSLPVVKK